MKKRPIPIVALSCLFLATGAVGLVFHLIEVKMWHPFPYDIVEISVVHLLALVCGIFMLLAQNWARWLAVAWMGFHFVISFFQSWQQVAFHGVLFALIAYGLFRPEAKAYFAGQEKAAV
jgi:hypothetical protein